MSSSGGNTASREPLAVLRVPGLVTTLKFVDERLFCGLVDGAMLIYSRNDGEKIVVTSDWFKRLGFSLNLSSCGTVQI